MKKWKAVGHQPTRKQFACPALLGTFLVQQHDALWMACKGRALQSPGRLGNKERSQSGREYAMWVTEQGSKTRTGGKDLLPERYFESHTCMSQHWQMFGESVPRHTSTKSQRQWNSAKPPSWCEFLGKFHEVNSSGSQAHLKTHKPLSKTHHDNHSLPREYKPA